MKRFNLALFAFCFCSIAWAQFYSSERVYCYEYVETINDGIKSKERKGGLYFCNIQNDILGIISETKERVRVKLVDDPDHYNEAARNSVARNYRKWNSSPGHVPTMGPAQASVIIIKYYPQASTSSTYTYREAIKYAHSNMNFNAPYAATTYWGKEKWGNHCYSFSSDRRQLIMWSINNPNNRDYYKLIDPDDLLPNLDFLE